jgi:hypothetical protein
MPGQGGAALYPPRRRRDFGICKPTAPGSGQEVTIAIAGILIRLGLLRNQVQAKSNIDVCRRQSS